MPAVPGESLPIDTKQATPPDNEVTRPSPLDESPETTPKASRQPSFHLAQTQEPVEDEGYRPPLPPRPTKLDLLSPASTLQRANKSIRPQLLSTATTAISRTDIHTQILPDGLKETYAASGISSPSTRSLKSYAGIGRLRSQGESGGDDSASIVSYAPTIEAGGDVESLLGEVLRGSQSPAWKLLDNQAETLNPWDFMSQEVDTIDSNFEREFEELSELSKDGENEEELLSLWKAKQKHYLILSSAGKPIYNRHGDDNLISSYIGIIQTIISFYEGAKDQLKGFTAGDSRFVIMSQGPLYLVAISKLRENDAQLRAQLDALYMQILSTLTLPVLTHLFTNRPSTDLRRPLQGTEPLLSALADTFTRGSPPTLLSALECLKIRKSHRQMIDNTLLKTRSENLLYGLVVAGGRLVSVIRPKKHSLHPSDLQLIFNMLFEAGGVKAGGGENWIPLCLPGFNKNGHLYMYVSFLSANNAAEQESRNIRDETGKQDETAILLISANKESFYELRKMKDAIVEDLEANSNLKIINSAVRRGRPSTTDIIPGTVLRHFLYKSRANVQFAMPSYEPHHTTLVARRRLLTLYHALHASVHAKNTHLKVQHCISRDSISLAWITPVFELYCVAGPNASRNALAQSANKIVQWAKREEERLFIIGGAVF